MPRKPIVAGVGTGAPTDAAEQGAGTALLRDALARWASGVAVVATRQDGTVHALTATAFMPLSLEPPLLAVAIGQHAALAAMLEPGTPFTVNVLAAGQKRWANVFADAFAVDRSGFASAGDAVLAGSLAAFTCRVSAVHAVGDHRLVIGEVDAVETGPESGALLYYERAYREVERP